MDKIKLKHYFKYKMEQSDIEETIINLVKEKFTKMVKISEKLDEQTKLLLSIFDIDVEYNNHYLSYMYMK